MTDFKEQIKSWHYKAWEEDYFSKYMFEYLAFIAYLQKEKYQDEWSDRCIIQKLKQDYDIKIQYIDIVNNNLACKASREKVIEELNRIPLWNVSRSSEAKEIGYRNCSHNKVEEKTNEDKIKSTGEIHGLDDWENMVEFRYSIRNNLFHWWKSADNDRDKLVVKHGYKTLRSLVGLFISELR
jgi:hypothetical protein